jgi:hypothetical protein
MGNGWLEQWPIRHRFLSKKVYGRHGGELDEPLFTVVWDYDGGERSMCTQREWNQTLVTTINQCTTFIYRYDSELTSNTLTCCPSSFMVLESLSSLVYEPIQPNSDVVGILMGRYVVNISYSMELGLVHLGTEEQPKLTCVRVDNLGL